MALAFVAPIPCPIDIETTTFAMWRWHRIQKISNETPKPGLLGLEVEDPRPHTHTHAASQDPIPLNAVRIQNKAAKTPPRIRCHPVCLLPILH